MLQPSLKAISKATSFWRALFWGRIVPDSAIFCQKVADYGTKSTFFATDFMRTCQTPRLWSHPNILTGPEHKLAGRPKHHKGAPHTYFPVGGNRIFMSESLVGYRYGKTEKTKSRS